MPRRDSTRKPGRKRLWQTLGAAATCLLLVIGGCSWHIGSAFVASSPPSIAPETTVIEGPLSEDGLLDYSASLNDAGTTRVPTEQNAAALLIRAFGPNAIGSDVRTAFLERLDAEQLPEEGDYLQSEQMFNAWLNAHPISLGDDGQSIPELFRNRIDFASEFPWLRDEMPEIAAWVDVNENPLDLIVTAAGRPQCFLPIREGPGVTLLDLFMSPLDFPIREAGRLLAIRANARIASNDFDGAWDDIHAIHRLARHVDAGEFAFTQLTADALESIAVVAEARLAMQPRFDGGRCRACLRELNDLGPPPSLETVVDVGERYQMLDTFQRLAMQSQTSRWATASSADVPTGHVVWNAVLRDVNDLFDKFRSAVAQPTYRERIQQLDQIGADIVAARGELDSAQMRLYRNAILATRSTATRTFSAFMIAKFAAVYGGAVSARTRSAARFELARITFALAACHRSSGNYPATLDELSPEYIHTLPSDPFTNAAFVYRTEPDGGYRLYSVGENMIDNDGTMSRSDPPGDDISIN